MKETVAITINVDPTIRQQLKIIAAKQSKSLRDLLLPELERLIQNAEQHPLCSSKPIAPVTDSDLNRPVSASRPGASWISTFP